MTGVSQEVLKNLVLAGVKAVLCDSRPYPDAVLDTPSFFTTPANTSKKVKYNSVGHACQAAVEELNPLLGSCTVLDKSVQDLLQPDDTTLEEYDIVVASRIGMNDASRVAAKAKGKFYLVDCFGWNGACVLDLGRTPHQYRTETKNSKLSSIETVQHQIPLDQVWKTPLDQKIGLARVDKKHPPLVWLQYRSILEYHAQTNQWPSAETAQEFAQAIQKHIAQKDLLKSLPCFETDNLLQWATTATAQISPVCAVLGGVIGNEVIKAISGKGEPANNVLVLDGFEAKCRNLWIKPK